MAHAIEVGKPAPDFSLPDQDGNEVTLSGYHGRALVLYFYPKDDTSGCTQEAVSFNEHAAAFETAGAAILGVSPDSPKSHIAFRAKHALTIVLASDETKEMLERYGVWVEKSMYGRSYMGVERTTVLIGPDGVVAQVWPKVKVKGHVEEVLKAVRALQAGS